MGVVDRECRLKRGCSWMGLLDNGGLGDGGLKEIVVESWAKEWKVVGLDGEVRGLAVDWLGAMEG